MNGATIGQALDLLTNIGLGWNWSPGLVREKEHYACFFSLAHCLRVRFNVCRKRG
jgi:hypothetical protein